MANIIRAQFNIIVCMLLLIAIGKPVSGQINRKSPDRASVIVVPRVISLRYCQGDSLGGLMKIEFSLFWHNKGQNTISLARRGQYVSAIRIARTREALAESEYELNMSMTWMPANESGNTERQGKESIIFLRPGQHFATKTSLRIPLSNLVSGSKQQQAGVSPGEHLLIMKVVTAPEVVKSGSVPNPLWSTEVWTLPVKINAESNPHLEECQDME